MIGGCVGYTLLDKLASGKADLVEGFCIALAIAGLFVTLVALRRIEMVQFKSTAGFPLIFIAKAGKRKAEFEGFVSELQTRIRAAAEDRANQRPEGTPGKGSPSNPSQPPGVPHP